jgi:hypothetical protein
VEGIVIQLAAWLVRLKESPDLFEFVDLCLDCRFELRSGLRLGFDSSCQFLLLRLLSSPLHVVAPEEPVNQLFQLGDLLCSSLFGLLLDNCVTS